MINLTDISIAQFIEMWTYLISPVAFIGAVIAWRDTNVRFFLLVLAFFHFIYERMYEVSLTWGELYYVWGMAMNMAIIFLILIRKYIAGYFAYGFVSFERNFFKKAYAGYKFKLQEGGIIALSAISALVCIPSIIEGVLYKLWIIDSLPYREYIYSTFMVVLNILTSLAAIGLAMNSTNKNGVLN